LSLSRVIATIQRFNSQLKGMPSWASFRKGIAHGVFLKGLERRPDWKGVSHAVSESLDNSAREHQGAAHPHTGVKTAEVGALVSALQRPASQPGRLAYIDGLRAVAIIAVVAFHARLPGFRGGFVGVDVFFVISGFLITQLIVRQTLDRDFSATDFYSCRMLRILPPLFVVTIATSIVARFFPVLPHEFRNLAYSAAATAAMISNYYFTSGTEYFDVRAEIDPLLHTWSLGVEEQYYLLAPAAIAIVIYLALRRKQNPIGALLILGTSTIATSYVTLVILTKFDHRLAFFSIMSRAWQFSLGAILAIITLEKTPIPKQLRSPFGVLGIACIAISVMLFKEQMEYPGWFAGWLPTVGAFLVLGCGLDNEKATFTRVLSSRPIVAIGLVSYSWYLWHWPLIDLARTLPVGQDGIWKNIAAAGAALVLSIPTYLLLERPLRNLRRREITRRFGGRIIAGGLAVSVALAISALVLAQYPAHERELRAIDFGRPSEPLNGCRSGTSLPKSRDIIHCIVGAADDPTVLFWGDSHALMLTPVAEWAARAENRTAVVLGQLSCPPLKGVEVDYYAVRTCAQDNGEILAWLRQQRSITGLVLAARWSFYNGSVTPAGEANLPQLIWSESGHFGSSYAAFLRVGLTDLMAAVTTPRILLVAPAPELKHLTSDCLRRAQLTGQLVKTCTMSRTDVELRRREALQLLKDVVAKFPNARMIDPVEAFCDNDACWPFGPDGVYYVDYDHLSALGAEVLYKKFKSDFAWAVGKELPK
jgi:peptidoglycan/LPS O-acetylase OafA/YrhL